ncbi:hypothetical protein C0J52_01847, partial [Blattella germanica]
GKSARVSRCFCHSVEREILVSVFVIIVKPRVKYPLDQRVFLFEIDTRKRSYLKCRIRFIRKFPGVSLPNKSAIHRLVCKLCETGAFTDKKKNSPY